MTRPRPPTKQSRGWRCLVILSTLLLLSLVSHLITYWLYHRDLRLLRLPPKLSNHDVSLGLDILSYLVPVVTWDSDHVLHHLSTRHLQDLEQVRRTNCYGTNLTLTTAFVDIGDFEKGDMGDVRSASSYLGWLEDFGSVDQCVVFASNNLHYLVKFSEFRKHKPHLTLLVFITNLNVLWSFSLRHDIHKIFHARNSWLLGMRKQHQVHYPNTYLATYSCAMHAKYDVLERAMTANYFATTHFSWIDVGIFRFLRPNLPHTIQLQIPPSLHSGAIGFTQINEFKGDETTPQQIVRENQVFVCGGYLILDKSTLTQFVRFYRLVVNEMIANGFMSTDQQVLYCMLTPKLRRTHNFTFQTFRPLLRSDQPANYTSSLWAFLPFYSSPQILNMTCTNCNEKNVIIKDFNGRLYHDTHHQINSKINYCYGECLVNTLHKSQNS